MKNTDIDRRIADLVAINPRARQPSALVALGRELLARDVDAATKCFDKAIAIDQRCVPAWIGRSEALSLLGRKGQAVGCLERAIDVDPDNAELAERKSKLLAELAVASSRNRRFEPPPSSNPIAKAPSSSSRAVVAKEAPPAPPSEPKFEVELETKPRSALESQPKSEPKSEPKSNPKPAVVSSGDAVLDEAAALLAAGRHIEALRKVEPLTKVPEPTLDAWMLRGRICRALDQSEAEIASYDRATKADPKSVPAWMALAQARATMKRLERALDAADQALLLAPFDGQVQKLRGKILMALLQGTAAVSAFEKATQHAPDDAECWLELGRALRAVKKPDAAREALRRALGIAETMQPELVEAVNETLEKLR